MSSDTCSPLAGWIRDTRRRLGMSRDDLAHACGVAHGTVARWERGTRPSRLAMERIVMVLGEPPRFEEAR